MNVAVAGVDDSELRNHSRIVGVRAGRLRRGDVAGCDVQSRALRIHPAGGGLEQLDPHFATALISSKRARSALINASVKIAVCATCPIAASAARPPEPESAAATAACASCKRRRASVKASRRESPTSNMRRIVSGPSDREAYPGWTNYVVRAR